VRRRTQGYYYIIAASRLFAVAGSTCSQVQDSFQALAMTSFRAFSIVIAAGALACSGAKDAKPPAERPATAPATSAAATTPPAPGTTDSISQLADRGRVLGAASAPIWMLMVSDFQCPYCKMWHDSTFAALKKEYVDAGKVRLAYINFPLGIHPNAWPSAQAAMCASAQGKFWEAHERIFATQAVWSKLTKPEAYLDSLAIAAGADASVQHACTQKQATRDIVSADQMRANKAGAETTPTFFVGGVKIEGAAPTKVFRHVIDSLLAAGAKSK
jgi:protein-disulfide isomerase